LCLLYICRHCGMTCAILELRRGCRDQQLAKGLNILDAHGGADMSAGSSVRSLTHSFTRTLTVVAAAFVLAIVSPLTSLCARADLETASEIENSPNSFTGIINSNAVYVRSGPGENYYATTKLDKG